MSCSVTQNHATSLLPPASAPHKSVLHSLDEERCLSPQRESGWGNCTPPASSLTPPHVSWLEADLAACKRGKQQQRVNPRRSPVSVLRERAVETGESKGHGGFFLRFQRPRVLSFCSVTASRSLYGPRLVPAVRLARTGIRLEEGGKAGERAGASPAQTTSVSVTQPA